MDFGVTWHEISGPYGDEIQYYIPLGCYDEEFGGYKSKFRNTHEEGGKNFLRNVYTCQTEQCHILFKNVGFNYYIKIPLTGFYQYSGKSLHLNPLLFNTGGRVA